MADKEFLLGNRARELLRYTNQVTKIVTDDISVRDVRKIIQKIAALDDIRDVKMVCAQIIGVLDLQDKKGFTKATYRCYGEDMRMIAKGIVRDIHAAHGDTYAILTRRPTAPPHETATAEPTQDHAGGPAPAAQAGRDTPVGITT